MRANKAELKSLLQSFCSYRNSPNSGEGPSPGGARAEGDSGPETKPSSPANSVPYEESRAFLCDDIEGILTLQSPVGKRSIGQARLESAKFAPAHPAPCGPLFSPNRLMSASLQVSAVHARPASRLHRASRRPLAMRVPSEPAPGTSSRCQ